MSSEVVVIQADRDAAAALTGEEAMAYGMADLSDAVQAFARHRMTAIEEAAKPWADYHGDLPDYDHPLRPVFESGIQYAVELLAKELGVEDYTPCDGTEEFDGDLGGTLMNIVLKAMPKDEHGDPIYPRDLPAAIQALSNRGQWGEAIEAAAGVVRRVRDIAEASPFWTAGDVVALETMEAEIRSLSPTGREG